MADGKRVPAAAIASLIDDAMQAVGLPGGNIFHRSLQWPWAESAEEVGTWGVETDFENVFLCGSSALRGGAVSGIPGHNAAMKVLELESK